MEALMSKILQDAVRTKLDPESSPMDLSWSSRKTCDRLVTREDLRREQVVTKDADPTARVNLAARFQHVSMDTSVLDSSDTAYSSDISESRSSSVCSDDSVYIKRESCETENQPIRPVHPFSIAALIGHSESPVDRPDTPAVVTSVYSDQFNNSPIPKYQNFISGLSGQGRRDSGFGVMPPVSSDSTSAYWCHVCNCLCMDYKDAETHRYAHRIQGARCNLRKSLFARTNYVSQHVKIDEEKTQCGLCDKVVTNCFFTKHQRLHDGHICIVCNSKFSTNSRLQDHMNVHTGNTPFVCTLCDRRFAKRSSLTQHQRYHRDHQSYRCNFCTKNFNSKHARLVHERLHTGENPYKCYVPGCTRAFPQKIQLKLHMSSHRF